MALAPADVRLDVCSRECRICYEAYKAAPAWRVPKMLLCQHSLCLTCLRKLVCQAQAVSFVVCPFCRTVTLVPDQGPQALPNNEAILRETAAQCGPGVPAMGNSASKEEEQEEEEEEASPSTSECSTSISSLSLDVEFNYVTRSSVFTISGVVSPYSLSVPGSPRTWNGLHVQEVQNAFLVGLPGRAAPADAQPPISVENLRLCFAMGILILIISVFFLLVFLK